jgi:hypothetical protein
LELPSYQHEWKPLHIITTCMQGLYVKPCSKITDMFFFYSVVLVRKRTIPTHRYVMLSKITHMLIIKIYGLKSLSKIL